MGRALQEGPRHLRRALSLIGPNCLGVMSYPGAALWAIPLAKPRCAGAVGLVAQSGNMSLTLPTSDRGPGHAHAVSVGNQAVVDAIDVIDFFPAEPGVCAIAAVIEGLGDVGKFRRVAARATARDVPIVVLKHGRSEKAGHAAIAHTGSLTGADRLYNALFAQHGVIRVDDLDELLPTAALHAADSRPVGPGLTSSSPPATSAG